MCVYMCVCVELSLCLCVWEAEEGWQGGGEEEGGWLVYVCVFGASGFGGGTGVGKEWEEEEGKEEREQEREVIAAVHARPLREHHLFGCFFVDVYVNVNSVYVDV